LKICKPIKLPVLTRVLTTARATELHVTTVLAFQLANPKVLVDEIALWPRIAGELGTTVFDEGFRKPHSEFLVAGKFFAPRGEAVRTSFVRVRVGALEKTLFVAGDRYWVGRSASEPLPMTELPIDWQHTSGGADDDRNPLGMGTVEVERAGTMVLPLPNVEAFDSRRTSPSESPSPASLLPMDLSFGPRRRRAGSFAADSSEGDASAIPRDCEPEFFNVGLPNQQAPGFWRGDETLLVENMHPEQPRIESRLPGLKTRAFVARSGVIESLEEVALQFDTVWLFPSAGIGAVVAHGSVPIDSRDGSEVSHFVAACEAPNEARTREHYVAALQRRLDPVEGALYELSDSDLMPEEGHGIAPNIDLEAVGQWTHLEGLRADRMHRGAERNRQRARARLLAEGGDPARYGLDEPIPPPTRAPPPGDLDAVVAFARSQDAVAAQAKARATLPVDSSGMAKSGDGEQVGGPPHFRASAMLATISERTATARSRGMPDVETEAALASDALRKKLEQLEELTRLGYRRSAHLLSAASPMTEEASAMAKLIVGMARDANESLTERDFTGADFRDMDLTGIDFSRAFLEGADLRGADLSGANFEGAVLAKADLRGAKLVATRLRQANLGGANLEGASLERADMREAILMRAHTTSASFRRAELEGADLLEVHWQGVDLRGARFERCTFLKADLSKANLTDAHLVQATFLECTLDDTVFDGANLHKASVISCKGTRPSFVGADAHEAVFVHKSELPEANFDRANLERCCLRTTVLRAATFQSARMTMSDLSECDATSAKLNQALLKNALAMRTAFDRASLRGANLNEALLTNARLAASDFTGAQLTRTDFTGAIGDEATRFDEAVVAWTKFDDQAKKGASA